MTIKTWLVSLTLSLYACGPSIESGLYDVTAIPKGRCSLDTIKQVWLLYRDQDLSYKLFLDYAGEQELATISVDGVHYFATEHYKEGIFTSRNYYEAEIDFAMLTDNLKGKLTVITSTKLGTDNIQSCAEYYNVMGRKQ
jgi:hypothetical protein